MLRRQNVWTGLALAWLLLGQDALAQGPWRATRDNTPGWQWLTPAERIEHQARIRGFSDYETCALYRREHRQLISARAQAAGQQVGPGRHDFCKHLLPRSR